MAWFYPNHFQELSFVFVFSPLKVLGIYYIR